MNEPLRLATALLDGEVHVPVHSARAAAWLTRTALEGTVRALIEAKGFEPGTAAMRSLLGCLEVLYEKDDPQLVTRAQYAWERLSQASHQHAYELGPTHTEVWQLVTLVNWLTSTPPICTD